MVTNPFYRHIMSARNRLTHNYATLSQKGFSTSKLIRTKRVRSKERPGSAPVSPMKSIKKVIDEEKGKMAQRNANKKVNKKKTANNEWSQVVKDLLAEIDDNSQTNCQQTTGVNASDTHSQVPILTAIVSNALNNSPWPDNLIQIDNIAGMASTSGLSLEEKKAKLRAEIEELEKQVQQEEDEELRELMERQQELKK